MRLRDRPHDREAEAAALPGASAVAAREALERALGEGGREALALIGDLERQPGALPAGPQHDLALAVAERVVDEVAERLAQAQLVGVDRLLVAGVDRDAAPALAGATGEAARHPVELLAQLERLRPHGQLALARAREDQEVLGQLREVIAFLDRRDQRLADLGVVPPGAQRSLELGLDHRHRGAQLMAGVRHEAAFAIERAAEAVEHLVQRLAEPADLVAGRRQRQPLVGAAQRDVARAPAHRLDGPEPGRGERIAEHGREEDGDGTTQREGANEVGQRVVAVLQRLADDHDLPVAAGLRQHARGSLDAGHAALDEGPLAASGPPQLGRADRGAPDGAGAREHAPVRSQQLREALLALPGRARRRRVRGDDGAGASAQPRGHALVEVAPQPQVDEQAGAREHERHRERERGREPHADGQPAHVPPSRRNR